MDKPVGGRGKKAPYVSTHVRIPEPIKSAVQELIRRFHAGEPIAVEQPELLALEDAIKLVNGILRSKKGNKKDQFEKLLTAIYGVDVSLDSANMKSTGSAEEQPAASD